MRSLSGSKNPGYRPTWRRFGRVPTIGLVVLCLSFLGGGVWLTINDRAVAASADNSSKSEVAKSNEGGEEVAKFVWCEPLTNVAKYDDMERYSLFAVLGVAIAGLLYAGMLVGQVTKADKGTPRMQFIAKAVRRRGQCLPESPVQQDRAADRCHHHSALS